MNRNAVLYALLCCVVIACHKTDHEPSEPSATLTLDKKAVSDNTPDYGDSIVYVQWKGPKKDYTILPKKIKDAGFFVSRPEGLVIDRNTGEVNVSKSETGIRYKIGFVKANTTDTAFTTLIVGGITYLDHIYSMSTNDTLASPIYDANPFKAPVCDASDDTDYPGNSARGKCEFDDDDDLDSPNGKDDEPPPGRSANKQNLRVRTKSGVINLKKSLDEGIFGSNPQNGDTKLVTIYYRLNDKSNKVLQSITVQVTYYEKKSDIPVVQQNAMMAMYTSFMEYTMISGKPRPPQIVITR